MNNKELSNQKYDEADQLLTKSNVMKTFGKYLNLKDNLVIKSYNEKE